MVLKVPRPAIPGGDQVGNVATAPSANTPFQSFTVPNLGEDFGTPRIDDSSSRYLQRMGQGGMKLAQQLQANQLEDKREAETLELIKLQNRGDAFSREIINRERSLLGENALGAVARAEGELARIEKELRSDNLNLTKAGEIARERYISQFRSKVMSAVASHERQQRHEHTIQQIDVSIGMAVEDGVMNYGSDDAIDASVYLIAQRARSRADMTTVPGSPDNQNLAEQIIRENVSKMYALSIDRALAVGGGGSLGGTTRAVELLEQAKHANLLTAEDLERVERAVRVKTLDEAARKEGFNMLAVYGEDAIAAKTAIESRGDWDGEMKDAVYERYIKERDGKKTEEDRVYAEIYDAAMTDAKNGDGSVDAVIINRLKGADARAVSAEMSYWEKEKWSGGRLTDQRVMRVWNGMLDDERAKLDYDEFLVTYANHFSNVSGERDAATAGWRAAKHDAQADEVAATRRLDKADRALANSHYTRMERVFERLVATSKARLDEDQRAQFVQAVRFEFGERHSVDHPITITEMKALVSEMMNNIVFTKGWDQTLSVYDAISGLRDEDGDLIKGDDQETQEWLWQGIEEGDRFEVLRWYRRDNDIPQGKDVDAKKLHNWIFDDVLPSRVIPPEDLPSVERGLKRLGLTSNEANRQYYYMRWLIQMNGS